MGILGIIPARYDSSRFPGKPLAEIDGKSMIRRVYEQCLQAGCLREVLVATDDERIFNHVAGFGGKVLMTASTHRSGTERCKEALDIWAEKTHQAWKSVINIQGDEPFIAPEQIDLLGKLMADPGADIGTLVKKISSFDELSDPNVVKVVLNRYGEAIYFSRSPIPYLRGKAMKEWTAHQTYFKHVGIYGFKSDILGRLPELLPTDAETAESLEQLRWIGYGLKIKTAETELESISIDTPADLLKITNIP